MVMNPSAVCINNFEHDFELQEVADGALQETGRYSLGH